MRDKWLFDIGDYLQDTRHLTVAQHGAYLLLLMHYYANGSLPNDDDQLRRIIGEVRGRVWREQLRPALRPFFSQPGWRHKRVEADIKVADRYLSQRRKAARARWDPEPKQLSLPVDNSPAATVPRETLATPPKSLKSHDPQHATAMRPHDNKKERVSSTFSLPRANGVPVDAPARKELKNRNGRLAPSGRARLRPPTPQPAATPNRKRDQARQRWEPALAKHLGAEGYAVAIDCLAQHPRVCDRITDAELREAGSGVLAAMLALRELSASGALGKVR